jgi:hypothetical protein
VRSIFQPQEGVAGSIETTKSNGAPLYYLLERKPQLNMHFAMDMVPLPR